jgi:hypothetical protein
MNDQDLVDTINHTIADLNSQLATAHSRQIKLDLSLTPATATTPAELALQGASIVAHSFRTTAAA